MEQESLASGITGALRKDHQKLKVDNSKIRQSMKNRKLLLPYMESILAPEIRRQNK